MKKICYVTTVPVTLRSFVLDSAINLHNKHNYDITFICDYDEKFEKELPEYIHYIPVKMKRGIDFCAIKSVAELVKVFKREKFDYVQYSTPNASLYASVAAKIAKIPIRVYAQWGIRYVGLSGIKRQALKKIEKLVCKLSTNIRAVSPKNMEFSISEGLYKKYKAKVIGNGGTIGVDMQKFDVSKKPEYNEEIRKRHSIPNDATVFGFVGRLSRDKGSQELLKAFGKLDDENTYLLLVGKNEFVNNEFADLMDWANNHERIIFAGEVGNSDIAKYYAAFNCYVHPTYREGFGMVLQEAGAMKNAIITTDVPGASEVMEDGKSCVLVPAKDVDALVDKMKYMINNQTAMNQIGREAYERTKELYERSVMLKNIEVDLIGFLGE